MKVLSRPLLLAYALLFSTFSLAQEETPNDWILNADSSEERFQLIQGYLRGFDQPMWEVGERYEKVHEALTRENYQLAGYHWRKIRTTIQNGYLKRPKRKPNADSIFFNGTWESVKEAFDSADKETAWNAFGEAKRACMACHQAEGVSYMNNQSLFELEQE